MNREEALKHELCPQWLKDAEWEGEVELSSERPYVVWKRGIWENGTWEYGTWKRGTWKGGLWKDGTWKNGIWENGTWEYGTWKGGLWKDGTWKNGTWEYGLWEYGTWKDGTWEGGFKSIGQCYWRVYYSKTHIKIGCKTKTIEEWKEWFASDEIYKPKRDSERFKKIKQAYLMALYAIELEGEE